MSKDFRQFLGQLERDSPHEIIRVKKPVNPAAFELTERESSRSFSSSSR